MGRSRPKYRPSW